MELINNNIVNFSVSDFLLACHCFSAESAGFRIYEMTIAALEIGRLSGYDIIIIILIIYGYHLLYLSTIYFANTH